MADDEQKTDNLDESMSDEKEGETVFTLQDIIQQQKEDEEVGQRKMQRFSQEPCFLMNDYLYSIRMPQPFLVDPIQKTAPTIR